MNDLINNLSRRVSDFSVDIHASSKDKALDLIEDELSSSPAVAASVKDCSYTLTNLEDVRRIRFSSVSYHAREKLPVFSAKTLNGLEAAVALGLRLRLSDFYIVLDNRTRCFKSAITDDYLQFFYNVSNSVADDFHVKQAAHLNGEWFDFFNRKQILFYKVKYQYYDPWEDVNDLHCKIALEALKIRKKCGNDIFSMLSAILEHFRKGFTYLKINDKNVDCSAVKLERNKAGVCRAFAVCACIFCNFLGIKARYVVGKSDNGSGRGYVPHGWNQVFFNNRWVHVDYTWQINTGKPFEIVTESVLKENHVWDENQYSQVNSSETVKLKNRLNNARIRTIPMNPQYMIDDCTVDTSNIHPMSINRNSELYVALFDIVCIYGGCYKIQKDTVEIFIATNRYELPLNSFIYWCDTYYFPAMRLAELGMDVRVEGDNINIKNGNVF